MSGGTFLQQESEGSLGVLLFEISRKARVMTVNSCLRGRKLFCNLGGTAYITS